ncbi:two-component system, OmpR family, sensor histidine kinase KdpD [Thermoflexales bacterium]|nr:two-component system, OmpR family, sensor histidine kinase KdpD [Thermoflexales bacterium]
MRVRQSASQISAPNDQAKQFDHADQLSPTHLAVILAGIADGITVQNPAGQLIYGNEAAARLLGYPDVQALLAVPTEDILRQYEIFDDSGQPLPVEYLPRRQTLRGLFSPPQVICFRVRATQEEHWALVTAQAVFDETGALEFVVNLFHDITDLKRSELSQRLLAQASAALSTSLDFETRLGQVMELVVPHLADWCAVDLLEADGTLRRLTIMHTDPSKVALAQEIQRRYPPHPADPTGLYAVLRSKQSQFFPEISDSFLETMIADHEQLDLVQQLQLRSLISVPLVARDRSLGALTVAMAESGRRYSPIDVTLAEDLAQRVALALDSAALYAEAQRLNTELEQRATTRAVQIETAYAHLRDEIAERRQAEEKIHLLNAQLEQRVTERTEQLERLNRDLQREVGERQQTSKTLRAVLQRTRELYRISQAIGSVRTPDEVLAALLSSSYLTTVSRASVAIFSAPFNAEEPPLCEILAAWNKDTTLPDFVGQRLTLEEVGLLPPYTPDKPVVIESVLRKKELSPYAHRRFAELKTHGLIIFHLVARGAWYGVLSLHYKLRRAIKVDDLRHMRGLVDQAAIAIDNIRSLAAEAKARQEAEQANELKLKFLAMISHELRTPLTSIKGFATTLLADDVQWLPANQRDFLRTIDEETDKLGDLIEQLLDLSRLKAGTLRIAPKPQTLEHVIATALAQLQTITNEHDLVLNVPTDLPLIYVDAQRISQVLTNLVGNAVRYSPTRTAVMVKAHPVDSVVQIDVEDQGPGIPPQARARVFEPFQQVDRPPTTRAGGAGLGLAICKGLVEAHGGHIWVQERAQPGTTISFTLPVAGKRTK